MNLQLFYKPNNFSGKISITGSKSESNRMLLLQAIYPNIKLKNISNSDDTNAIISALESKDEVIDIHHAGTAMRFLSAYFAFKPKSKIILTGSNRMQNRPIKILIDALRDLGAIINYIKLEGFPPIQIKGLIPKNNLVKLSATTSSQYISALMLVAPKLSEGLTIELSGKISSLPYIKMTESLLKNIGVKVEFKNRKIIISNKKLRAHIPFPEVLARKLKPGIPIKLKTPTSENEIIAKVAELKPKLKAENRSIDIIADIDGQSEWQPGASVKGTVIFSSRKGVAVPEQSVVLRPAGQVVYIVNNNIVEQRKVVIGVNQDGLIEIISGLEVDEIVALDGAAYLSDKTPINISSP